MREMTRGEVQDLLPDLLHDRLSAEDAESVQRAIASDPELAAELALLDSVRRTFEKSPAPVNISRIVGALPTAPTQVRVQLGDELAMRRAARRPLISARFARAAALLVVIGGGTFVSVFRPDRSTGTALPSAITAESVAAAGSSMELGLGAYTDDLTVDQLRALEADIRSLDGVPSAELDGSTDPLTGEGA